MLKDMTGNIPHEAEKYKGPIINRIKSIRQLSEKERGFVSKAEGYEALSDAEKWFGISRDGGLADQIMEGRIMTEIAVRDGRKFYRLFAYAPKEEENFEDCSKFFNLKDDPSIKQEVEAGNIKYNHTKDCSLDEVIVELVKPVAVVDTAEKGERSHDPWDDRKDLN